MGALRLPRRPAGHAAERQLVHDHRLRRRPRTAPATRCSSAAARPLEPHDADGLVAVSDYLAVTSTFSREGAGRLLLSNGQAWQALGFAVGQNVYVPGFGIVTVLGFDNSTITNPDGTSKYPGGIMLVDSPLAGMLPFNGTISVTSRYRVTGTLFVRRRHDHCLEPDLRLRVLAQVGQLVSITGLDGVRTIESINGNTITVSGGGLPVTGGVGTIAAARVGGDDIRLTGPAFTGTLTTTASTITRTSGSRKADGFAIGQLVLLNGGTFHVDGVTDLTLTVSPVNGSTLAGGTSTATVTVLPVGAGPGQPYDIYAPLVIYGDTSQDGVWYGGDPHTQSLHNFGPKPMPHIEGANVTLSNPDDKTATITLNSCTGRLHRLGQLHPRRLRGRQELALGPLVPAASMTATFDIYTDHLTLHSGTWTGFSKWPAGHDQHGAQRDVDGRRRRSAPCCSSTGRRSSRCRTSARRLPRSRPYVGIVKAVTATKITLNLKLSLDDFPTGPHFPVSAGGSQTNASENIRVLNRVGNSAPFFVFPLANPYLYSGNDVIDAHLLDWADAPNALRAVGVTVYGGPGDDMIIGSQTGDHLAGGSGNDTILGQRGEDHIYGDSGFNVDLITRLLTSRRSAPARPATRRRSSRTRTASSPATTCSTARAPAARRRAPTTTFGNDDDIIFGDLGVVSQYVAGAARRHEAGAVAAAEVSTTARCSTWPRSATATRVVRTASSIDSEALQNGGDDWIYGNVDRDLLVGGPGNDAIDGGDRERPGLRRQRLARAHARRLHEPALPGAHRHAPLQPLRPDSRRANADNSGQLLTDGVARNYRDRRTTCRGGPSTTSRTSGRTSPPTRHSRRARRTGPAASATTTSPAARRTTCSSASSATTRSRATARSTTSRTA